MTMHVTKIINDYAVLKRMANAEHVTIDGETKRFGYVADYASRCFCFKGKWHEVKYYDGCWKPFVTLTKKRRTS